MYRELKAKGAKPMVARRIAANSRRWWRNSARSLNGVLTIAYFDQLGMPLSYDLNFSNRPVRTRMPSCVAGVSPKMENRYADFFVVFCFDVSFFKIISWGSSAAAAHW